MPLIKLTMMGLVWAVVALAAAARSKEATFWMSWPDAYARGGGVGNQIEQLLGRVQCAMREGRPHHRLMVLPDLRSDRAKPPRRYRFEDVFDYGALRGVADVATWRDALDACGGRASVVEAGEAVAAGAVACRAMGAGEAAALLETHAKGYEAPRSFERCEARAPAANVSGFLAVALPRCAVGVEFRDLLLLGPCARSVRREPWRAFKNGRTCAGLDVAQSPCAAGFDWSSSLNETADGLVVPSRAAAHLAPCDRTAVARLDATEPRARALLAALNAAPALLPAAAAASRALFGATGGRYDAVHVRLGDFGTLCARGMTEAAAATDRRAKFCPPSPEELASVLAKLDDLGGPPLAVLLLSDEPAEAARRVGGGDRVRTMPRNDSLVDAPRLAVEMELAVRARAFVGVACSTVSQLVIKRRLAQGRRPHLLWP